MVYRNRWNISVKAKVNSTIYTAVLKSTHADILMKYFSSPRASHLYIEQ